MTTLYEKLVYENMDKGFQYRLVCSEFRDTEYIHLRKYFLSYEGEWVPSKEGAAIPASIQNVYSLLDGILDICSKSEDIDAIKTHLSNKLLVLKSESTNNVS